MPALTAVQKDILRFLAEEPCRVYAGMYRGAMLLPSRPHCSERQVFLPIRSYDLIMARGLLVRLDDKRRAPNLANPSVARFLENQQ